MLVSFYLELCITVLCYVIKRLMGEDVVGEGEEEEVGEEVVMADMVAMVITKEGTTTIKGDMATIKVGTTRVDMAITKVDTAITKAVMETKVGMAVTKVGMVAIKVDMVTIKVIYCLS